MSVTLGPVRDARQAYGYLPSRIHCPVIIVYYAKWQHRQKYNYIHKIQKSVPNYTVG